MSTLFLAPTAREARRAAHDLLRENRPAALSDWLDPPLVFTEAIKATAWRDLARENASQTAPAPRLLRAEAFFARSHASLARRRALSGFDRMWVLQSAARRAATRPQNAEWETELSRIAAKRESLQSAARHIAMLRRANISQFPAAPGADVLNALLREYDARLESLEAFDFEAAPAVFALSAPENRAFAFPRALVVDDLIEISPALQIGLQTLFERAETVVATLVCGGEAENAALENVLEFWKGCGAKIVRTGDFQNARARVAARILGAEIEVPAPKNLFLTPAHTPREEMERIASQIRAELDSGAKPNDFALGCADLNRYEADARHAFEAFGVPLDWPLASPLMHSPLVRALVCALDSTSQKLDVHALHNLFGDGTAAWQNGEKRLDARRLRAAGLAARHLELDDIGAARAAFERKRAQLVREARHDDAPNRARLEAALAGGDLELVADFQAQREMLSGACTAKAWQTRVVEFCERLAAHWLETDSVAAKRAQNDLARFWVAIENVASRARGWDDASENEPFRSAADWLGWLKWELESGVTNAENVPVGGVKFGGVKVGGIDAANLGARGTFWCGLSEDVWPRSGQNSGASRELDALLNAYLAPPIARALHQLARAAGENEALYLSNARFLEGQETPASPLLDDLRAAFHGATWLQLPGINGATPRAISLAWNGWFEAGQATFETAAMPMSEQKRLGSLAKMRTERRQSEIGVYDGVLGARGRELMELRDQNGSGARLSGSDLEFYARCPLRYFFERVLNLRHPERLDDDLDARASGTLVHAIARRFIASGVLKNRDFDQCLETLGEIARAECDSLPIRPILREAEWRRLMGFDGQSGPLVRWLKLEIAPQNAAWSLDFQPLSHFDSAHFGLGDGLEFRFETEIGGHKVRGFIDRIDAGVGESGAPCFAILDYKTGDVAGLPSWKNGDSGLHFQLAIYALALRSRFPEPKPRLAMAYLTLKTAKIARGIGQIGVLSKACSGGKPLEDDAFESWLEDVSARAARIGDLRGAGVFNLSLQAPKEAKCSSCGSKSLCGQHLATQTMRSETHRDSPFFYLPATRGWDA